MRHKFGNVIECKRSWESIRRAQPRAHPRHDIRPVLLQVQQALLKAGLVQGLHHPLLLDWVSGKSSCWLTGVCRCYRGHSGLSPFTFSTRSTTTTRMSLLHHLRLLSTIRFRHVRKLIRASKTSMLNRWRVYTELNMAQAASSNQLALLHFSIKAIQVQSAQTLTSEQNSSC